MHAGLGHVLLVEDEECPEADVSEFLFVEIDFRGPCGIPYIRCGSNRPRGGCTARQRHRHADHPGNRYGLLQVLLLLP